MFKLLLFLSSLLFWLVILVPSYFIIVYFRKRKTYFLTRLSKAQIKLILAIVGLIYSVVMVWNAYHPSEKYYLQEFKYLAEVKWPLHAKVMTRGVQYSEEEGNYSLSAILKVEENEVYRLIGQLKEDSKFALTSMPYHFGKSIRENTEGYDTSSFTLVFYKYKHDDGSYFGNIAIDTKDHLISFEKAVWE